MPAVNKPELLLMLPAVAFRLAQTSGGGIVTVAPVTAEKASFAVCTVSPHKLPIMLLLGAFVDDISLEHLNVIVPSPY